jgi:hypothetical protein
VALYLSLWSWVPIVQNVLSTEVTIAAGALLVVAGAPLVAGLVGSWLFFARKCRLEARKNEQAKMAETEELRPQIAILSAKYGKGERMRDVTGIVKAIVAAATAGCVRFTVNNDTLGGDPIKKEIKELKLVYSYAGETRTITVREYEELSLP